MTSISQPRAVGAVDTTLRGRPIRAWGWIELAAFVGEVDFFVTESIRFLDTNEPAPADFYNTLTLLEFDAIDFAFWHEDDLADEDYGDIDFDDDTPDEEGWAETTTDNEET